MKTKIVILIMTFLSNCLVYSQNVVYVKAQDYEGYIFPKNTSILGFPPAANRYTLDNKDIEKAVKGKSVVTGVKTNKNHGNHNPLTGHFINIVGMGFDDFGNYFSYYDNATSDRNIGTNLMENRFYFGNLNKNARVM